jgi:hypothetical protein
MEDNQLAGRGIWFLQVEQPIGHYVLNQWGEFQMSLNYDRCLLGGMKQIVDMSYESDSAIWNLHGNPLLNAGGFGEYSIVISAIDKPSFTIVGAGGVNIDVPLLPITHETYSSRTSYRSPLMPADFSASVVDLPVDRLFYPFAVQGLLETLSPPFIHGLREGNPVVTQTGLASLNSRARSLCDTHFTALGGPALVQYQEGSRDIVNAIVWGAIAAGRATHVELQHFLARMGLDIT